MPSETVKVYSIWQFSFYNQSFEIWSAMILIPTCTSHVVTKFEISKKLL